MRWHHSLAACIALAANPTSSTAEPPPAATAAPRSEAEFLLPPQGGAVDVPIHLGTVCILSFPDKLDPHPLASSPDFEFRRWSDTGIAVRASGSDAHTATTAIATRSGAVKVNVTLTVVPADQPAYTLVRFKPVSQEEVIEARVKAGVEQRMVPLEAALAEKQAELDRKQQELDAALARARSNLDDVIRERAEATTVDRLFRRYEVFPFTIHARNDAGAIVNLQRGAIVGNDGYLLFELENRSSTVYRLAKVRVLFGAQEIGGAARLSSPTATRDPALLGEVPPGVTARGVVVVRGIDQMLGKHLSLVVTGAAGSQPIQLDSDGIVFR